jgi:lipid-A-disaccharide synthase
MTRARLLVVAGESSGDQRAARLVTALGERVPGIEIFGLGSEELAATGADLVADSREISVVGIAEAIEILPRASEIFRSLVREAERRRPAVAVLVDFPDFNLRLARELAWLGIPVVYYVSPQIWAWRRGRVRTVADCVDRMLVLFPFEVPFYRAHGVRVVHVGHPLVDEVPQLEQAWQGMPPGAEPEVHRLALLPGSRRSEVAALLPAMLGAAQRIAGRLPVEVRVIRAPGLDDAPFRDALARTGLAADLVTSDRYSAVAGSHLALCASGTATLETGLLGTPMIVCYRLSPWTYWPARALVRVPHVALVNLVLGKRAVPELIQGAATPERIADEALRLLASRREIRRMRVDLGELRERLGAPGATRRAAAEVARYFGVETAA